MLTHNDRTSNHLMYIDNTAPGPKPRQSYLLGAIGASVSVSVRLTTGFPSVEGSELITSFRSILGPESELGLVGTVTTGALVGVAGLTSVTVGVVSEGIPGRVVETVVPGLVWLGCFKKSVSPPIPPPSSSIKSRTPKPIPTIGELVPFSLAGCGLFGRGWAKL